MLKKNHIWNTIKVLSPFKVLSFFRQIYKYRDLIIIHNTSAVKIPDRSENNLKQSKALCEVNSEGDKEKSLIVHSKNDFLHVISNMNKQNEWQNHSRRS